MTLGDFFRGSPRQNHVPWGRLSLWKWVPGISPGVKAAGAYGWRTTTLVVPKVKKIRGLNLPGTPRATSACHGKPLLYFLLTYLLQLSCRSVAVVLTLVQTKQIRINIRKQKQYKQFRNKWSYVSTSPFAFVACWGITLSCMRVCLKQVL